MITAFFIVCILQCVILSTRLRVIAQDRLDAFGYRIELITWLMFMMLALCKKEVLQEPIIILFLILICSSRILTVSSFILGHPHQQSTFSISKETSLKK